MEANGLSRGYTPVVEGDVLRAASKEVRKCDDQIRPQQGNGRKVEVQDRAKENVSQKSQNTLSF